MAFSRVSMRQARIRTRGEGEYGGERGGQGRCIGGDHPFLLDRIRAAHLQQEGQYKREGTGDTRDLAADADAEKDGEDAALGAAQNGDVGQQHQRNKSLGGDLDTVGVAGETEGSKEVGRSR